MKKLEYMCEYFPKYELVPETDCVVAEPEMTTLRKLGAQGWELCAIERPEPGARLFYFKREVTK